ncbi:MAG TPA: sulfate permease [Ilumatobacteraceae bacterium]|nr:sulfate permease [Ilumatobacteraceae bacterium]
MTTIDQPTDRGASTGWQRSVPGIGALRNYERSWLRFDLIAGVVLAAILVPQGMAYAELAGLPAVTGLYTTIACLVGYAVMGPSRILLLGPDSSVSPLIFAAIVPLVVVADDPATAIALAGMMAIIVGLILIGLGIGKLGFVADLLSKEVQVGYMNGLAITIVVGQLPKLCGFSTDADGFIDELQAFVDGFSDRNPTALWLGLGTLAVLLLLPRLTRTLPAVLVAVVGATVVTGLFDLDIATVGTLPEGLPRPALPWTSISDVAPMLAAAVGITLVSLTDTIATSTAFAARRGEEVKPDQEMIGIGSANIAAGLFSGFAVSTSSSRTAVADQTGAKSQLTGLVGALMVALLLLFFNGLLKSLPQTALAAVVIAAAFSLVDLATLRRYFAIRKSSFVLSLAATGGVVFFGVLQGILIAVVLSILLFFKRSWWPHGEVLGRIEGAGWHSAHESGAAEELPGIVVYRWEAPLFFANSGMFRQQVRELARERNPRWVILQCEAITDIDVTAADVLQQLDDELNAQGIHLAFVELRTRLKDLVYGYGLFATLDRDHFYDSIEAALAEIQTETVATPNEADPNRNVR